MRKNQKFWLSISEQLYSKIEKVFHKSCLTTLDCTKIHAKTTLILIYINPATIPTTFRESHKIDQVYRQDISKHLYTNAEKTFYKTHYSALDDPKNLGQMVLPIISFNPITRPTTSRHRQKDSLIFLDRISKELDTQSENVFTKVVSLHFNISTFWMLLILVSINPITRSTTSRKSQTLWHCMRDHIEAVIDSSTNTKTLTKVVAFVRMF